MADHTGALPYTRAAARVFAGACEIVVGFQGVESRVEGEESGQISLNLGGWLTIRARCSRRCCAIIRRCLWDSVWVSGCRVESVG